MVRMWGGNPFRCGGGLLTGEIPVLLLPSVALAERIAQASMSETTETGEFPSLRGSSDR
jgi:hypothetical protein